MAEPSPFRSPFVGEDPVARAQRIRRRQNNWRNTVLRRQRILKARGYINVVDGNWGRQTSSAWWRLNRGLPPVAGRALPIGASQRPPVMGENAADKAKAGSASAPKPPILPPSPATQLQTISQRAVARARAAAAKAKERTPADMSHASAKALAGTPRRAQATPLGGRPPSVLLGGPTQGQFDRQQAQRTAAVKVRIEAEARSRFQRASAKKDDPGRWDSRDIVALFGDPTTKVRDWVNKPEWVGRIQRWLTANGHYVGVTGIWNVETADAMKAEMNRRARNYQRWRANQLLRHLYHPLGYKPGQKGFPVLGTAPTPEALLKMADQGGFTSTMVFTVLGDQLNSVNAQTAWRKWQDEFLDNLLVGGKGFAQARSAYGPFLNPMMLDEMPLSMKYAAVLLGMSSHSGQQEAALGQRLFDVTNDPTKKDDTFYEEVRAVAESTSHHDLVKRVAVIRAADEKNYQFFQAWREGNKSWVNTAAGAVVHALGVPAEEFQDGLVAATAGLGTIEEAFSRAGRGRVGGDGQDVSIQEFTAQVRQDYTDRRDLLQAQWDLFEKEHPVYSFGVDLVLDPLNLIPAAWIGHGWQATKSGVKAVDRAGEILRASTQESAFPLKVLGNAGGVGLQLAPAYLKGTQQGLKAGTAAFRASKVGRLGRSIKEQVDTTTEIVNTGFYNAFGPGKADDPLDLRESKDYVHNILKGVEATDPITGRKFNILEEIASKMGRSVDEMTKLFTDFVVTSSKNRLSLYTHKGRQVFSDYGAANEAAFADFSRVMEVDKYAAELAKKASDELLDKIQLGLNEQADFVHRTKRLRELQAKKDGGGSWRAEDERDLAAAWEDFYGFVSTAEHKAPAVPKQKHTIPTIREPLNLPMTDKDFDEFAKAASKTIYKRVYAEATASAGTHFGGGKMDVEKLIHERVQDKIDLYRSVLAPALQEAVERSLDNFEQSLIDTGRRKATYKKRTLFTEKGDYAHGNRSDVTTMLRDLLRDTFDDLDVEFGPTLQRALGQVKKIRAEKLKQVDDDFAEELAAIAEKEADLKASDTTLREALLGERLVELHPLTGDKPPIISAFKGDESVGEAAARVIEENGLDAAKFEVKEGASVRKFPVLINKKDKSVVFGHEAEALLARMRADDSLPHSDWFLAEARIDPKGKVQSLANEVVDLETGELNYEVGRFTDESEQMDPKFRKAKDDLSAINGRIEALNNRKKGAKAAHTADGKASWTERDQLDLNAQYRAKRNLIKNNPAVETYFFRGRAKKSVQRHVESLLNREVGDGLAAQKAALREEKAARIAEVNKEVDDVAASLTDPRARSKVFIKNQEEGRVLTQDEYDEYLSMRFDKRAASLRGWASRRRAIGDMADDAIDATVARKLDEFRDEMTTWFKDNGDGTFTFTKAGFDVPAIYARGHLGAYADALKGRHPILTNEDVPPEIRSVLSLAGTPADRPAGVVQAMERLAAMATGARPHPVWPKFTDEAGPGVVKGRKLTFERSFPNRVGVAATHPSASGRSEWADRVAFWSKRLDEIKNTGWTYEQPVGPVDFVTRYNAQRAALKVGAMYAYPRVTLRQGAWIRALKEAQSGHLKTMNDLMNFFRELFVFAVLPGRPGAFLRNVFDSVIKIAIIGLHDPRYFFISGATKAETDSRKLLKSTSSNLRGAVFENTNEAKALQAAIHAYESTTAKAGEMLDHSRLADIPEKVQQEVLSTVTNFWQLGINDLDMAIRLSVGPKYADAAAAVFRHTMNTGFWARPLREVRDALRVNGVDVPDEAVMGVQTLLKDGVDTKMLPRERMKLEDWAKLDGVKEGDIKQWVKDVTSNPKLLNETRHPVFVMMSHLSDVSWDLMVGRPEGRLRRGVFNVAYAKEMKNSGDSVQALAKAMRAIDKSLFDYSKQTVLDENLRHIIPFYFFWRRNLAFWATESVRKPYLPAALVKYEEMMEQAHSDDPEWSRRYLRLPFLNDGLAKLPFASWVLGASSEGFELGTDPMSWISAAPLYRAFKGSNPTLPADKAGLPFISGLVEGMNDFGLSMSPWFRKPAELAGIFDYRAWQMMLPQTSVVEAFTQRFLPEMFPDGLNFEEVLQDSLFQAIGVGISSKELNQRRIDEWVQTEMAAQAARGEPVDRAAAEKKVKQFVYLATMFAFLSGAYPRHLDPTQLQLYKIQEQLALYEVDFLDLSPEDQKAYRLFIRRKMNPLAYDAYVKTLPAQEAYYAIEGDWDQRQDYLNRHPEIIPYVDPSRTGKSAFGKPGQKDGLKSVGLIADTGATIATLKVFNGIDLDEPGLRDQLQTHFVTPELKEFWARNDTPRQRRDRMLKGEVFGYLRGLRQQYFAIPEKDHEARSGFLQDNPLLAHSFTVNDEASDDLKDVLNLVNNDLREVYFEHVEKGDWDGAAKFLARYPRIFEFTKAASRVSDDGIWLPSARNTARAQAYLDAYPHLQHYYALKKQDNQAAQAWLKGKSGGALLVRNYFKNYTEFGNPLTTAAQARAYVALKPQLDWFFDQVPDKGAFRGFDSKWDWVMKSTDPAAVKLRSYFKDFGQDEDSEKQRAYLENHALLKRFFETAPEKGAFKGYRSRWAWVYESNDPEAKRLRDYFKKWGSGTKSAHAKAYVAAKDDLKWFFEALPEEGEYKGHFSKWDWVYKSKDPRAVKIRNYFQKWSDKDGMSQHAKDYVAIKGDLQRYFAMKEKDAQAANEWLNSDAGEKVLRYFKKYGKANAAARKWGKWVRSENPEVNRRLMFWKRYFELEPDQRPAFVHAQAENYGVFVWGTDADVARHEHDQDYLRKAKKRHLSKKVASFLKVRPLLDLMHTLNERDTKILLRLNPDLREYLDTYGKGPNTGSKALDKKVETYFKLPPDSNERAAFLRKNPEVQDYFDKKNPADAAMHNLLEVYFSFEDKKEQQAYRDMHPEISDYFDRKREERSLLSAELQVFDRADPRDDELRERAQFEIVHAAEQMWSKLRGDMATHLAGDEILVRRERDEKARKNRRLTL